MTIHAPAEIPDEALHGVRQTVTYQGKPIEVSWASLMTYPPASIKAIMRVLGIPLRQQTGNTKESLTRDTLTALYLRQLELDNFNGEDEVTESVAPPAPVLSTPTPAPVAAQTQARPMTQARPTTSTGSISTLLTSMYARPKPSSTLSTEEQMHLRLYLNTRDVTRDMMKDWLRTQNVAFSSSAKKGELANLCVDNGMTTLDTQELVTAKTRKKSEDTQASQIGKRLAAMDDEQKSKLAEILQHLNL